MSGRYSTSGNADLIVVVKPTNATFVNCPPNRPLTVEVPIIPIGELADKNRDKWVIETHFDESDVNKSCGACEEEVISACTVQDQHGRNTNTRHARYNYLNLGDSVEENIVSQRASQLWSSRPCMETRDDECDAIENRETCEEEEITTCTVKDQHGRNTNTKYHQYNYTNIPGLSRRGPVEDFIMPQQASRYWSSRETSRTSPKHKTSSSQISHYNHNGHDFRGSRDEGKLYSSKQDRAQRNDELTLTPPQSPPTDNAHIDSQINSMFEECSAYIDTQLRHS